MRKPNNWPLAREAVELIAGRFKVLSEPIRILILQSLHDGPMNVTDITRTIASTQPNVSKHLKMLQAAGLITRRQSGNTAYYAIADDSVYQLCDVVCASLKDKFAEQSELFG